MTNKYQKIQKYNVFYYKNRKGFDYKKTILFELTVNSSSASYFSIS